MNVVRCNEVEVAGVTLRVGDTAYMADGKDLQVHKVTIISIEKRTFHVQKGYRTKKLKFSRIPPKYAVRVTFYSKPERDRLCLTQAEAAEELALLLINRAREYKVTLSKIG
jgi:hypothetical protein